MDVYCIRHGQTVANVQDIKGVPDTVLTPQGEEQARTLASGLSRDGLSLYLVVSSPLIRAVQTAEIIAGRLGIPLEIMPGLAARNLGELTGCDGQQFSSWMERAGYDTRPPGGESLLDLERQMKRELEQITRRYSGQRVLIVVHNGLLRVFDHLFLGVSAHEVMSRNYRACTLYPYTI